MAGANSGLGLQTLGAPPYTLSHFHGMESSMMTDHEEDNALQNKNASCEKTARPLKYHKDLNFHTNLLRHTYLRFFFFYT